MTTPPKSLAEKFHHAIDRAVAAEARVKELELRLFQRESLMTDEEVGAARLRAEAERDSLAKRVEKLRKALTFYADKAHWDEDGVCREVVSKGFPEVAEIDEGYGARAALTEDDAAGGKG